jgi:hypothetical protein
MQQLHMGWWYGFVNKVPILTAPPEQATAIARDTGDITTHPFQSSLVNIGEQATLTDLGISHTIDQIVGVEYASHMMVPSATNIMRIHGLSQIIRMNNQGSKRKMDLFQRVKIMSTQTDDDLTVCKKTAEWPKGITLLLQTHSITKCFTQKT